MGNELSTLSSVSSKVLTMADDVRQALEAETRPRPRKRSIFAIARHGVHVAKTHDVSEELRVAKSEILVRHRHSFAAVGSKSLREIVRGLPRQAKSVGSRRGTMEVSSASSGAQEEPEHPEAGAAAQDCPAQKRGSSVNKDSPKGIVDGGKGSTGKAEDTERQGKQEDDEPQALGLPASSPFESQPITASMPEVVKGGRGSEERGPGSGSGPVTDQTSLSRGVKERRYARIKSESKVEAEGDGEDGGGPSHRACGCLFYERMGALPLSARRASLPARISIADTDLDGRKRLERTSSGQVLPSSSGSGCDEHSNAAVASGACAGAGTSTGAGDAAGRSALNRAAARGAGGAAGGGGASEVGDGRAGVGKRSAVAAVAAAAVGAAGKRAAGKRAAGKRSAGRGSARGGWLYLRGSSSRRLTGAASLKGRARGRAGGETGREEVGLVGFEAASALRRCVELHALLTDARRMNALKQELAVVRGGRREGGEMWLC